MSPPIPSKSLHWCPAQPICSRCLPSLNLEGELKSCSVEQLAMIVWCLCIGVYRGRVMCIYYACSEPGLFPAAYGTSQELFRLHGILICDHVRSESA